jgi:hypothetical protein
MGPSPNAVFLSDIHQIASGVGATVAVLSVLSNRKSRLDTRQPPPSAVDWPHRAERQRFACIGMRGRVTASGLRDHARRCNSKLLYASNAVSDLIMTGVLERYPRLKFVLVENEVSWIPFYLSQDHKYWVGGIWNHPHDVSQRVLQSAVLRHVLQRSTSALDQQQPHVVE